MPVEMYFGLFACKCFKNFRAVSRFEQDFDIAIISYANKLADVLAEPFTNVVLQMVRKMFQVDDMRVHMTAGHAIEDDRFAVLKQMEALVIWLHGCFDCEMLCQRITCSQIPRSLFGSSHRYE